MKKTILSLLLLATGILGAQAQNTEDLDTKYAKDFLPVGMQAPNFILKKAKDDAPELSLSSFSTHQEGSLNHPGCYVLLDFWATWCGDCRKEIPTVKQIYQDYKKKVKLIGISFDTDKDKMKDFTKENEMKWTMICNKKEWKQNPLAKAYNIKWIPTLYLIDPEGKIAYATVTAENMAKKLKELDEVGKLTPYIQPAEYPGGQIGRAHV